MNRFEKAIRVLLGQELPLPKNKWLFVVCQKPDPSIVQTDEIRMSNKKLTKRQVKKIKEMTGGDK